jgi:alpha-beta hydrolase superfamily lysophospholipase
MDLEAEPVWFGPAERPLLGWLHRPAGGMARGGVLICPPVGLELSHSHYVLRCLARELRAAGFAVLRFDYDGTGQSAGDMNDPGRVDAWRASAREALRLLRDTGVPWLAGVGLRLGATLLADLAAADELDASVLWDPCESGKAFLREQIALHRTSGPPAPAEAPAGPSPAGVEILGYHLGEPIAAELRALVLPASEAFAGARALVLADPTRAGNARLAARLPADRVEWREYAAAEPVFDSGELAFAAPATVLGQIVEWLDGVCCAEPAPCAPPSERREAVVGYASDGGPVLETTVMLGEHRLAGIECAPASGAEGPTVLLVSLAGESSIGPVRQWVELARRWAASGVRSVRVDLSGIGESPVRPGVPERTVYAHEHVTELGMLAAAVSPHDPRDVVLVGLCSGAFQALAVGPQLRPRGIVAANPLLTFAMPRRAGEVSRSMPRAFAGPAPGDGVPAGRRRRWRRWLRTRTPRPVWGIVYALGLATSPAPMLRALTRARVDTLLMLGAHEASVPLQRTPGALRRLGASGASEVQLVDLDHSLRNRLSRETFAEAATDFLRGIYDRSLEPAPLAESADAVDPRATGLESALRTA